MDLIIHKVGVVHGLLWFIKIIRLTYRPTCTYVWPGFAALENDLTVRNVSENRFSRCPKIITTIIGQLDNGDAGSL